jgi:hypothetical protein
MNAKLLSFARVFLITLLAGGALPGRLCGAVFIVTNPADSGIDSLRQAITDANNAGAGPHAIKAARKGVTSKHLTFLREDFLLPWARSQSSSTKFLRHRSVIQAAKKLSNLGLVDAFARSAEISFCTKAKHRMATSKTADLLLQELQKQKPIWSE